MNGLTGEGGLLSSPVALPVVSRILPTSCGNRKSLPTPTPASSICASTPGELTTIMLPLPLAGGVLAAAAGGGAVGVGSSLSSGMGVQYCFNTFFNCGRRIGLLRK